MDKTGEDLNGLHLGKFEKRRATFFLIYISLYQNVIKTAEKSFSVDMWPWFCKCKTLALPIWHLELVTNKIKRNYQREQRDLAPLSNKISLHRAISTGKNNGFPILNILGYLKNTQKNPKFGKVRQIPIREFPNQVPKLGFVSLFQIWDFFGYSLNTLKYPKLKIRYFFLWSIISMTSKMAEAGGWINR